jgi:ubiquitin-like 1-activating enzyme E1 A
VPFSTLPPRSNLGYVLLRLAASVEASAGAGARLSAADAPSLAAAADAAAAAGLPARATPPAAQVAAYAAGVGLEAPPLSAVVGGVLAQEVLKSISGSGAPVHNFFLFDTFTNVGAIQAVGVPAAA